MKYGWASASRIPVMTGAAAKLAEQRNSKAYSPLSNGIEAAQAHLLSEKLSSCFGLRFGGRKSG
jgi:hypothetical protein